ncbi:hypothetical protein H0I23_11050 [Cellulophaga sp. HaHaR_3_176]|uniref:hypothetical protein n=1 Tax=Cellulophaga sp. HaHaR_3_176 TaxID=1942464 RepID=UPI001C1F6CB3|nr:hypothetical protein [Cellulophaga sp. HaHaR_3_176]QWX82997.1 hypothetical protein H0I23_11050 [Cellulophaga sp. HaHaR_3_176]
MKLKWITNPVSIDKSFIETEVTSGNNVIVQWDKTTYTDEMLSELNTLAGKLDNNLQIRFYGHSDKTFDCKTLLKVSNVKSLSINCLKKIKNLNQLSELKNLEKLIIGLDDFKDVELLKSDNLKSITELHLGDTKNMNLEYLKDYNKLNSLGISGQFKNIDSIGEIENLETLTLSSIGHKESLSFVNQLKKLKHLHISLGSRENIDEINGEQLETLKLLWIKNLQSLNNLSRFKNLKYLQVENQRNITTLEFNSEMKSLSRLGVINCKGLEKLEGLEKLKALKTLVITRSLKLEFDSVINQKLAPTLEHFNFITERKAIDKGIKEKIRELGYKTT